MATRFILLLPALSLALSACTQIAAQDGSAAPPAAAAVDPASSAHCDAGKATDVVGQSPSPETQERARTDAGAEVVRVLRHNQPITKEFRMGRLNLVLGADGKIASVNCS
jgi:hypothetical protein